MEPTFTRHQKIEVVLFLHPKDHECATAAARATNMSEAEFYALALHLGTTVILRNSSQSDGVRSHVVRHHADARSGRDSKSV
jgi:hypothetical protein